NTLDSLTHSYYNLGNESGGMLIDVLLKTLYLNLYFLDNVFSNNSMKKRRIDKYFQS
ncbi:20423_t:CDS:1, partial [Gigaspora margarita]